MTRALIVLVAAVTLAAPTLASASAYPVRCPLSRSPYLPRGAMDDTLACPFDEDGNGLDDEVELEIARCFVPEFVLDADENAIEPGEPLPIFSALPLHDVPGGHNRVLMRWVFLYGKDGGTPHGRSIAEEDPEVLLAALVPYVGGAALVAALYRWNTAHEGDTEQAELTITIRNDGRRWSADLVANDHVRLQPSERDSWWAGRDCLLLPDEEEPEFNGTHPRIYLAAGKHHAYQRPHPLPCHWNSGKGPALTFADHVRGNHPGGPITPVDRIQHAPLLRAAGGTVLSAGVVATPAGDAFVNACHAARGIRVAASRLVAPDLTPFGYAHDRIESGAAFIGDESFTGSLGSTPAGSITSKLAHEGALEAWWDHDGDGKPNAWPMSGPVPDAFDACPWSADPAGSWGAFDRDHDLIPAACDADDLHRSRYVAGGTPGLPAVTDASTGSFAVWGVGVPRGGFLDVDLDHIPDGEDGCPLTAGTFEDDVRENANRDAELAFLDPTITAFFDLGTFERADRCDPNPVAIPAVSIPAAGGGLGGAGMCGATTLVLGDDVVPITISTTRGESHNGPTAVLGSTVAAQTYRCACRTIDGDRIDDAETCLNSPASECSRWGDELGAGGHGWMPIHRTACGPGGCWGHAVPLALGATTTSSVSWDWRAELATHGPGSEDPHFAPGDFVTSVVGGTTVYDSRFEYVFWTQTFPGASLGVPTTTVMPDPEHYTAIASLADPFDPVARALRAGYSIEAHGLVSRRELPFGAPCPGVDGLLDDLVDGRVSIPGPASDPPGWGDPRVGAVIGDELIWVEVGEGARWARTTFDGAVITEGQLPGMVSEHVQLVPDQYGEGAALLDPVQGATWRFDVWNDAWIASPVDVSAVVWQPYAEVELSGVSLTVHEGWSGGAWSMNLISGESQQR